MGRLEDLPNIGTVLAGRLRAAGIATPEALLRLGDARRVPAHPRRAARRRLHPHPAGARRCRARRSLAQPRR